MQNKIKKYVSNIIGIFDRLEKFVLTSNYYLFVSFLWKSCEIKTIKSQEVSVFLKILKVFKNFITKKKFLWRNPAPFRLTSNLNQIIKPQVLLLSRRQFIYILQWNSVPFILFLYNLVNSAMWNCKF